MASFITLFTCFLMAALTMFAKDFDLSPTSVTVGMILIASSGGIWLLALIGGILFDSPTQFRLYLYGLGTGYILLVLGLIGFGVYSLIRKRIEAKKKGNNDEN